MPVNKVPVLRPLLPCAKRLLPYLERIDASRVYTNYGPLYYEFIGRLCHQFSCEDDSVVCASSGTDAIAGAILAVAGRAEVDRPFALIPAFTFTATALAAEMCGYRVLIADVSADHWALDSDEARNIPGLDEVGVIVPVAPFGRPVDPHGWKHFQQETGIPVVIDAAACFEAVSREPGKYISDLPIVMSFHATKSFSTGEGGCVISRDRGLIEHITQCLNFGFMESRETTVPGINGKMSEYTAAVGLAELDSWTQKQSALEGLGRMYQKAFEARGIAHKLIVTPQVCSSYVLHVADDPEEARAVRTNLKAAAIDFRYWYGSGLHRQNHFCHNSPRSYAVSERLAAMMLSLPVAPDMEPETVSRICDQLVL